jgi:hypothetical protein
MRCTSTRAMVTGLSHPAAPCQLQNIHIHVHMHIQIHTHIHIHMDVDMEMRVEVRMAFGTGEDFDDAQMDVLLLVVS